MMTNGCSKAPEHNADHGETDEGSNGGGIALKSRANRRLRLIHRTSARRSSVLAEPQIRQYPIA